MCCTWYAVNLCIAAGTSQQGITSIHTFSVYLCLFVSFLISTEYSEKRGWWALWIIYTILLSISYPITATYISLTSNKMKWSDTKNWCLFCEFLNKHRIQWKTRLMGIVSNKYSTVIHKLPDHDNVLIKWNVVTQKNWWLLFNGVYSNVGWWLLGCLNATVL